ncbi:amidohydrolase [Marinimicrobium sp. ABcell2]|uniref:amidohydrolase family protein n=1 Tax=Marinimicrobium sp. ABcell2 TaxID=3069751 RepID=UPI0027B0EFCA|nr:amidohydrolase family protein [Marinimicrobium sp. ABcell2]MDQ2077218.1 amidohydrolase family protein [Marinimicrobium sp. ABcell2]
MTDIIDAHQHCWELSRPECQWPTPELEAIYRDFDVSELEAQARPLGVVGSVLVQSQPSDADTDYLLAVADQHEFVRGVVGWVDLKAPNAAERIERLARHPKLKGLRPMLQALSEDDWIDDPALAPAVDAMIANNLSFDALVYTRHLPFLGRFAARFPRLTIILDHAAKPPIAEGTWQPWRDEIAAIAARRNIYCKLSGLVTEAAPDQGLTELKPWVEELLTLFGPSRLLWGSDWPVVNLEGGYRRWLRLTEPLLASLSEHERSDIMHGTARRVYRIKP